MMFPAFAARRASSRGPSARVSRCVAAVLALAPLAVSAQSLPSTLADPGFDGFAFRAPLDAARPAARSDASNCTGGVPGQAACFEAGGWFPYVEATPGRSLGEVARDPATSFARIALPGGGTPIGNYASLSQSPVLARDTLYRVSARVRPGALNDNDAPYVSVFCDRPEGGFTVYQGTDTALARRAVTGIDFRVAGDGARWICSVRLLGQPGEGGREGVLTAIEVPRFSIETIGRVVPPDVPAVSSREGDFEGLAADLSDSVWQVVVRGAASPRARIEDDGRDAELLLSLDSGDDGSSVTVSQPLSLVRGGRYRLCGVITNRDRGRAALANLLVARALPIPGSQGGFVTGPVDVALGAGQTRRVAVPFVAPSTSRDYRLVTRALGYGNAGAVALAFDDVRVVAATERCA